MKQTPIGFRDLLEHVLPLDELPSVDRLMVQRALQSGIARQLEAAALLALERLEGQGALRRIATPSNGRGTVVRYQPRDRFEMITLELPAPVERDGIVSYARSMLPSRVPAGLDQLRRLLRLDDANLLADPRTAQTRDALVGQLDLAGRELLGAHEVRFFAATATADANGEPPFDPALASEAIAHPGQVLCCGDIARSRRLEALGRERGVGAVVVTAVLASDGSALGHLEVRSAQPRVFDPEQLARVALLADFCGGVLERAARIEKLVFIDSLTGVYNRSYFDLQAHNEMARAEREQASMALCIADIDDFKSFNTTFGYEAGNEVLIQVAQALKRGVRPFDTVARWGGEEFVVLLTPPVTAEDVMAVCERLRGAVQRMSLRLEGLDRRSHGVSVTLSIGVALFPEHAETAQDLWRVANQALLVAKRPPKNKVVFYQPRSPAR